MSRGQLAPCQEKRIKQRQAASSARCKVLAWNAGFLLAPMPSYCRFKPIECSYSESVSVSVPQDKNRGSAIGCSCPDRPELGRLQYVKTSISAAGVSSAGLRGDNYSRINTPEIFTVLMQTMDRQTIIMQSVHHVLVVAFHSLM